jgi:hypothetical protein
VQAVKGSIPSAELTMEAGAELSFRLPFEASPAFPALFEKMDAQRDGLGLSTYGVSVTTLEVRAHHDIMRPRGHDREGG